MIIWKFSVNNIVIITTQVKLHTAQKHISISISIWCNSEMEMNKIKTNTTWTELWDIRQTNTIDLSIFFLVAWKWTPPFAHFKFSTLAKMKQLSNILVVWIQMHYRIYTHNVHCQLGSMKITIINWWFNWKLEWTSVSAFQLAK